MKLKLNKETWFVIAFTPVVLGVVTFMFMASSGNSDKEETKQLAKTEVNSDPLLKKLYEEEDMTDALSKNERMKLYEKDEEKYGFSHLYDDIGSKDTTSVNDIIQKQNQEPEIRERKKKKPINYTKISAAKQTKVKKEPEPEQIETEKTKEEPKRRRQNSFYSSKNNEHVLNNETGLVHAVVHNDHQIKSGSTVRLRLTKEAKIEGKILPKNTYIFGIASFTSERVIINVTSINFKGTLIRTSLTAFDLDGIQGLYVPGGISEEISQDGVNEGIKQSATATINVPVVGNITTNALSKKANDPVVKIPTGYKLLFKLKK